MTGFAADGVQEGAGAYVPFSSCTLRARADPSRSDCPPQVLQIWPDCFLVGSSGADLLTADNKDLLYDVQH